jgi:predicted RNA-binding Zn-ribbon protein involved in translation (DUF1610 family)
MHNPLNHPWVVLDVERRSEIPGAVRGRLRWVGILIWVALGVTIAIVLLAALGVLRYMGWLWTVPALNFVLVYGGPRVVNRRLAKEVAAAQFQVCTTCSYQLTGLPENHVCPSCGTPYSLGAIRAVWRDWFSRTLGGWHPPA